MFMNFAGDAGPAPTVRKDLIDRLARPQRYDLAVVGGGATGLGVALDAAARGLSVVLVESHDFAKGSSSRATKLVHGGVHRAAGELPQQPAVDGAESQFAALGLHAGSGHLIEQPHELGG